MQRKRFTDEQIIGVLSAHEAGAKFGDLTRKHGISEAALDNWKQKYGGMDVSDARRLRALQDENAQSKQLPADQTLGAPGPSRASANKTAGPATKRDAMVHLQAVTGLTLRRAISARTKRQS